ncbi:MAG TPA: DUF1801 domain-containing protein [Chitinophagaceae bacterium]|nr:DUF1801 domain-containing protein [Chitinophagaceae bacterium]
MESAKPASVEAYIASFSGDIREKLEAVRTAIRQEAPAATEDIRYGMPTFIHHRNLVHFAAFKNHIGFYSTPSGHTAFDEELSRYKGGKGSVQFPLDEPLPLDLIRRIVRFRVAENEARANATKKSTAGKKAKA